MKFALISDIHGNLQALEAVLADCAKQKVEAVHCLGDVVGYGGDPGPCLELVDKSCTIKLLGNHEYAAMGKLSTEVMNQVARTSLQWTREQLTDRHFGIMAEFAIDATRDNLYFVHASPCEPEKWRYVLTAWEATKAFDALKSPICFVGHTHLPMIFSERPDRSIRQQVGHDIEPDPDNRYIINIGSVGQPRDNDPRACYVVFDTAEQALSYRRIEYNLALAQQKMTEAHLPQMLIDRLQAGR